MERIRWMPATNGGPGCYIQFGPWDRKGYKGDFLTIRELRGGELRFDGYHRPEWPSERPADDRQTGHRRFRIPHSADARVPEDDVNDKVYIHEFIDIIGPNRARYMHHMTANWCPVAREERNQLCFGVWGTVGSTGRWPEVVNMWELDGWDGLVANFGHELTPRLVAGPVAGRSGGRWPPTCAAGASTASWCPSRGPIPIESSTARGVRGEVYAHELFTTPPGRSPAVLEQLARPGPAGGRGAGPRRAWAPSTWPWSTTPSAWPSGPCPTGRPGPPTSGPGDPAARCGRGPSGWPRPASGSSRTLLVDAPLAPLRLGRQPLASDRRPLDEL